ncbi:hypothetical protein [Anaerorudis cellulosivorans]|uniref:hypothetical protein n=1 Tax=Anaerorudis cellulosivorans TaxID=3397862 RepID=UPI00221F20D1|nr:hypothetical protein [Seramator thermalis]MCW1735726.1 hypothetical protein [Seramator thermalis]
MEPVEAKNNENVNAPTTENVLADKSFLKSSCEKQSGKSWLYAIVIAIMGIIAVIGWIIFTLNNEVAGYISNGNFFAYFFLHCIFLIVFLTLAVLFIKIFREFSQKEEKKEEFNRKKEWEKLQHELYHANKSANEIKALEKKIEDLEEKINKFPDNNETRKQAEVTLLLAIGLISQDASLNPLSMIDKLEKIEEYYHAIKDKLTNITL